jgi:hypothetical protein
MAIQIKPNAAIMVAPPVCYFISSQKHDSPRAECNIRTQHFVCALMAMHAQEMVLESPLMLWGTLDCFQLSRHDDDIKKQNGNTDHFSILRLRRMASVALALLLRTMRATS